MKIWLKDLHKVIEDARKFGVSGKGAMLKIYPSTEGDTRVAIYTDKNEYIADVCTAYWEKDDNESYLTYLENVPNVLGELEFTKDTLKVVNGDIQADCTYDAYPRLQFAQPTDVVLNDLTKATAVDLDIVVDNDDLKTMISLADSKNYITIGKDFMGCTPTPGYGSFILETENNSGIDEPFCITKKGAKLLSKTNFVPQPLTVYKRTYGQIGAKIDNLTYQYMERMRDVNNRHKGELDADTAIRLTEVVRNTMTSFGRLEEKHNPTIRLPVDFIETILKLKSHKDVISFRGIHGQKEITVKAQGVTYSVPIDETLNKDLDMHLTLEYLQRYLKPMKKYGGTITYNNDKFEAKFTYDGIRLKAGLLGVRQPKGGR